VTRAALAALVIFGRSGGSERITLTVAGDVGRPGDMKNYGIAMVVCALAVLTNASYAD